MSISKTSWLYIGQSIFGLLIGFMVGLSVSPVVGTVLGLMFAFIGGSLILLIKNKTKDELEIIGKCITALSSFMLIGILIGIMFRANDLLTLDFLILIEPDKPLYIFDEQLKVEDIEVLGSKEKYSSLICSILKNKKSNKEPDTLSKEQLKYLIDKNIDQNIIFAMLGYDVNCQEQDLTVRKNTKHPKNTGEPKKSNSVLYLDKTHPDDERRDDMPTTKNSGGT